MEYEHAADSIREEVAGEVSASQGVQVARTSRKCGMEV